MAEYFTEENGMYCLRCEGAAWATDRIHQAYADAKFQGLGDVDWVIEHSGSLILVEYKNAKIPDAGSPEKFNPMSETKIESVARKFAASLFYLLLQGKKNPWEYIYVVESDKLVKEMDYRRLSNLLTQQLQAVFRALDASPSVVGQASAVKVRAMPIDEWNRHPQYGQYPICPVSPN